jgi:hypothetical protein
VATTKTRQDDTQKTDGRLPDDELKRALYLLKLCRYFDERMGLFILRYDDARASGDPERAILEFFNSAYSAGADAAGWDRARLEAIP